MTLYSLFLFCRFYRRKVFYVKFQDDKRHVFSMTRLLMVINIGWWNNVFGCSVSLSFREQNDSRTHLGMSNKHGRHGQG